MSQRKLGLIHVIRFRENGATNRPAASDASAIAGLKAWYTQLAIDFGTADNDGGFVDHVYKDWFYRYDKPTDRIFIGTLRGRKITTFYKWDGRPDDPVLQRLRDAGKL